LDPPRRPPRRPPLEVWADTWGLPYASSSSQFLVYLLGPRLKGHYGTFSEPYKNLIYYEVKEKKKHLNTSTLCKLT